MIVVKVGGSLFDHSKLGSGLRAYLASLEADVLLVPGGGPVADAVRELDRTHALGEEVAHWLALQALDVTGALLERLLSWPSPLAGEGGAKQDCEAGAADLSEGALSVAVLRSSSSVSTFTPHPARKASPPSPARGEGQDNSRVLDPFTFAREDEARPGALPHTWSVTTDSIAARAAVVFGAERLVLLKSVDVPPGTTWETAAANGWVDAHFPQIAQTIACPIEVVNFRWRLDARA